MIHAILNQASPDARMPARGVDVASHPRPGIEATLVADTLEDAIALAKRALGPEALIVSSRHLERAGRGPKVEVCAVLGDVAPLPLPAPTQVPAPAPARVHSLLERLLRDNDVPATEARDLALWERTTARTLAQLRAALVQLFRERVGFDDRTASSRIIALVGPTGVGKTTTIAKLAAHDALVLGKRVALVSMDDYRLAGAEQLARFGELMDVPCTVAPDAAALAYEISRLGRVDRIYVDTPGRSPRSHTAHAHLAGALSGVGASSFLCVSAATRSQELLAILGHHDDLELRAIVVTKLDEAELAGAALTAALRTGLPLSHFATGQRVPEDIEVASPERLASLFLGEEVGR